MKLAFGESKFAFIAHLLDERSLVHFDGGLSRFRDHQLKNLLNCWEDLIEPVVVGRTSVRSKQGVGISGEFISLFKTTPQLTAGDREESLAQLQSAVDLAVANGAEIIGLGGYTSIISNGGRALRSDVPLTTGNSYTVVAAIQAIEKAAALRSVSLERSRVCVVGAAGSIGSAASRLLARKAGSLVLVGSPQDAARSVMRLTGLVARIVEDIRANPCDHQTALESNVLELTQRHGSAVEVAQALVAEDAASACFVCTTDIDAALRDADIVLVSTSSTETLIKPGALKRGGIVCDLSVPHNVSESLTRERPDVLVFDGGIVRVPGAADLGWNFGLDPGLAFACMCETMLIAMEPVALADCAGPIIKLENLEKLRRLGERHGFELEDFRWFGTKLESALLERSA